METPLIFLFRVTLVSSLLSNGGHRVEGIWKQKNSQGFPIASKHSKIWLICPLVADLIIPTTFPSIGVEMPLKGCLWCACLTSHYCSRHHHVKGAKCLKPAHCSIPCVRLWRSSWKCTPVPMPRRSGLPGNPSAWRKPAWGLRLGGMRSENSTGSEPKGKL